MTVTEQLVQWVKGKSLHNEGRGECCPDFSCCRPELLAPEEVRKVFLNAHLKDDEDIVNRLLMEFLGKSLEGYNVHIAGLETARQELE